MQLEITVVHTLAPEVLELLKNFNASHEPLKTKASNNGQQKEAPVVDMPKKEHPKEEQKTSSTSQEIKIEDIRQKYQEKKDAGKREKVKSLLDEFGVKNLTSLAVDQYSAFYQKLIAV